MRRYRKEILLILLLILSIFIKSHFLFSVSLFFIAYILFLKILLKRGLENVGVKMRISSSNVIEGSKITLKFQVQTFSFLPVVEILPQTPVFFISKGKRNLTFSPIFNKKDEFETELVAKRRGKYILGRVKIRTYDPLGLVREEKLIGDEEEVYVFPRIIKISRPRIPVKEPSFGIRVKEKIFEDYTSLVGVREYSGNEDLKKIHWKISAHTGELMVKEFPPTAITTITVLIEPFATRDKRNEEIFLNHISTITASLFNYFEFVKFRYGLWIIGKERIPEANGKEHLIRLLREISSFEDIKNTKFTECLRKNWSTLRKLKNIILIKRTMGVSELLDLMKMKNPSTFVSILLIPDFGFLFPWEKPHPYQPRETPEIDRIRRIQENIKRERINIMIIRGNDSIERFTYI